MPIDQGTGPWAVYHVYKGAEPTGRYAVCTQSEWDAMLAVPVRHDLHSLVEGRITNEGLAERLARGTSGDPPMRPLRRT